MELDSLFKIANKLAGDYYKSNSYFTFDEIQSNAFLGLAKGLHNYKDDQGKKLTSWVYSHVNWEILKCFENEKKHKNVMPYDYQSEDNYSLEERIGSEEFEECTINEILIEKALMALTSEEIRLVHLKFYNQLSYSEISSLLHIPKTSVSNKIKKALEKMKNKITEKEVIKINILTNEVRKRKVEPINTHRDYIVSRVKAEAQYLVETQSTIREVAKVFGVSRSTVHRDLVQRLPKIDLGLFNKVCRVLDYNLEERAVRGGESTKRKYLKECRGIDDKKKVTQAPTKVS